MVVLSIKSRLAAARRKQTLGLQNSNDIKYCQLYPFLISDLKISFMTRIGTKQNQQRRISEMAPVNNFQAPYWKIQARTLSETKFVMADSDLRLSMTIPMTDPFRLFIPEISHCQGMSSSPVVLSSVSQNEVLTNFLCKMARKGAQEKVSKILRCLTYLERSESAKRELNIDAMGSGNGMDE